MATPAPHDDAADSAVGLRDSIAARLLRIIFGAYLAVAVVVTCLQLALEYRNTEDRVVEEIQAMQQTFGRALSDAMWNYNTEVLRGIASGIKEIPIVQGVRIDDENGALVHAQGLLRDAQGRRLSAASDGRLSPVAQKQGLFDEPLSREYPILYTDEHGTQRVIGRWTVFSNRQVVVNQVKYAFVLILVNAVLKTLALWFIFLYVVRRWLGRPLQQLSEFVGRLNIDNLGGKPFVLEDSGRHELHLLASKINSMVEGLRASIAKNAALYEHLRQENAERRSAEDALRSSEQRLRSIIDNSPAVVYLKDLQGRYLMVNRRYGQLHHVDALAIEGRTDVDLYPAERAAAYQAVDRKVLAAGAAQQAEELVPLDDGPHTFVSVKFPLRDGSGRVYAVCGISTDITERKRAEEALRRSEEKYRSIVEGALEGIFRVSMEGRVLSANPAGARMLGYDSVDEVLRKVTDLANQVYAHPEDRERILSTLVAYGAISNQELKLRHAKGQTLWASFSARLVRDEAGRPVFIETFASDVTARKLAEAELKRSHERLEELVAERTAELTRAKELADVANQAKSAFLANMSHELRTPLNAVLGFAQLLQRDDGLNERQRRGLGTIEKSGEHLLALIDDVLDLAKVEAGKLELLPEPVELRAFLDLTAEIIRVKAVDKGLRFVVDLPAGLPGAACFDAKRLRQVLLNLLNNAVKFTDQGHVTLRVRAMGRADAQVRLRFEVEDSGVGIAPEAVAAIFMRFEQVGDATRRAHGSGLGLAISRQLVLLMGGDIHVDSQPGRGSRFWFELALPVAPARAPGIAAPGPPGQAITGYLGSRCKVLVVDDNAANRATITEFLAPLGFEVTEADNGQAGLERAQAAPPDLILMDSAMPVMGGREATHRLRQLPQCSGVPIIVVSANATNTERQDILAGGASAYLPKPVNLDQLLAEIGALLRLDWRFGPRSAQAAGPPTPPANARS
ncbi:PAS domain S-box protein [Ideonella sp. BN130291]|uniref:PAS domain S-box protein n=1 Tax=Ideonella sp. BN130291 TaxID=3112940 RepID=UPI002E26B2F5|nr:PAS domain S-box protein [Ideonella sp. BN130291]